MTIRDRISDVPPDVRLVSQQTIDPPNVEKWMWKVEAPTKFAARRRARVVTRSTAPAARNILNPKTLARDEAKQSKLRDFFPNSWHAEEFVVEIIVVR